MRIAFDVKGTIDGPRQELVLQIFRALQDAGHEMFVWSNSFSYAVEAVKEHNLNAIPMSKFTKFDAQNNGEYNMDLAIEDDRSQTYLGARQIVFVDELTENLDSLNQLSNGLLKGK